MIATPIPRLYDLLAWYNVKDWGLVGDGVTDETTAFTNLLSTIVTAGGGTMYFPAGTYLIGGALQDTSASNCQLRVPAVAQTSPQITINLVGCSRPPFQFDFGHGPVQLPVAGYSIIKSTLTGATGTAALIAGRGPAGGENNVSLNVQNLIFQMPSNPTLSCINLLDFQANAMKDVLIHCGSVDLSAMVQPTHSNAYGIKSPPVNHSAYNHIDGVTIFGYYTGYLLGELDSIDGLRTWGCYIGVEAPGAYHPCLIQTLGTYWGPYGIRFTGTNTPPQHYLRILLHDIEHANGSGSAWQQSVYDVDDASGYGVGEINWVAIASGYGVDHQFAFNGAANLIKTEVGAARVALTSTNWWDAGGPIKAIAVYQPKGAASLAASYSNLVSPGTNDAAPGVAPTWDAANGWKFDGSTQYLTNGITPTTAYTMIVRFSTVTNNGYLCGCYKGTGTILFALGARPLNGATPEVAFWNGPSPGGGLVALPAMTAGNLAVAGPLGFRNGAAQIGKLSAASSPALAMYIGALNQDGAASNFGAEYIQALAIYPGTLTPTQIAVIYAAMSAL